MKTSIRIKHQQQPTDGSCVHTCLAMLAGIPVDDVVAKFPWEPLGNRVFDAAINALGYRAEQTRFFEGVMFPIQGIYYCTVTGSKPHITHMVLIKAFIGYDDWKFSVFDPLEDKPHICVGTKGIEEKFEWKLIDASVLKPVCERARSQFADLMIFNERLK